MEDLCYFNYIFINNVTLYKNISEILKRKQKFNERVQIYYYCQHYKCTYVLSPSLLEVKRSVVYE